LAALPFPFAGLLIVTSNTAPNHFTAAFVARHDSRSENTAAKAKCSGGHDDDEFQQQIIYRTSSGSLAMLAAIRRAFVARAKEGSRAEPLRIEAALIQRFAPQTVSRIS
jgi:hypothetical protein